MKRKTNVASESEKECEAIHKRWIAKAKKISANDFLPDQYESEELRQCEQCVFYVPLTGRLQRDWGVCANESSSRDGHVMFAHHGCIHFLLFDYVDASKL